MYNYYSDVVVTDCVFQGNSAWTYGGGMYNTESNPTFVRCTFRQNMAGNGDGGGAFNVGGATVFKHCLFATNSALGGGGGVGDAWGGSTLVGCTFTDNSAIDGGAINLDIGGAATISNCIFCGNRASVSGGAISCYSADAPTIANSTFTGNVAGVTGGAMSFISDGGSPSVRNCILWGNTAMTGPQCALPPGGGGPVHLTVSYTDLQGGSSGLYVGGANTVVLGAGILDADPLLTPDGRLRGGSPCIDAGSNGAVPADVADVNTNGNTTEPLPLDIDHEARFLDDPGVPDMGSGSAPIVDLGADEFLDGDDDALPDAWELAYFGSPTAANPAADSNTNGLSNLEEFEETGTNPAKEPLAVPSVFPTIQAAIDAAVDGDTVLVAPGTYTGPGNYNLALDKRILVRASGGPDATTIDGGGAGRAVDPAAIGGLFAGLEGFTLRNGAADYGGGIRADACRLLLKDCRITDNLATYAGGGVYLENAAPTLDGLTLAANGFPYVANGVINSSAVYLRDTLSVTAGTLLVGRSWFDGPGRIDLGGAAVFHVTDGPAEAPVVVHCDVTGTGQIIINTGQQLHFAGDAVVNLSGVSGDECLEPGSFTPGRITVYGSLVVRERARMLNSYVDVRLVEFGGSNVIRNNNIGLLETSTGYGGEFFVSGDAIVECNTIVSEGDRYLDLDPDPNAPRPTIRKNYITVIIKQGANNTQGTLLELRSEDRDCDPLASSNGCPSGAEELAAGESYDNEFNPWVLERIEVRPDCKVNLTNREGFEFVVGANGLPETLYVKEVRLYPDAVLNTALQRLYYQTLVDGNGVPLARDPQHPNAPMANGSRIVDEPLLGFSLGVIAMEDDTEFDVRIRSRVREGADPPSLEGWIGRVEGLYPPAGTNGVMDMRTQAPGMQAATSVAAKGAFARAGDENVRVIFKYLFVEDPGQNAELIVYLSDDPKQGRSLVPVARLRPPEAGRPGAIGSGRWGVFWGQFPRGALRFQRGTYVELELRGAGSRVWIDDFDPQIACTTQCGDLNGSDTTDESDFLVAAAEFGRGLDPQRDPPGHMCLDNTLSGDFYVDLSDLMGWDSFINGDSVVLNWCGQGGNPGLRGAPRAAPTLPPEEALVLGGKSGLAGEQDDFLYALDMAGGGATCFGDASAPAAGPDTRSNGRLVRRVGTLYQTHAREGLLRVNDGVALVPPRAFADFGPDAVDVYVGVYDSGGELIGLPLLDAVFDPRPNHAGEVYVVPVLVVPGNVNPDQGICPYKAAAKLRLLGGGNYDLVRLYGTDPVDDSAVTPLLGCRQVLYDPDVSRLREIEADAFGNLYILAASGLGENDWLLLYDEAAGNPSQRRVPLSGLVNAPSTLMVSSVDANRVYLASSISDPPSTTARVYAFDIVRGGSTATGVTLDHTMDIDHSNATSNGMGFGHVATIAALNENPADGTLYVTGVTRPVFDPEGDPNGSLFDPATGRLLTTPTLAVVPSGGTAATAAKVNCNGLALPVSAVWLPAPGPTDFDHDRDVDLADYVAFSKCFNGPNSPPAVGCTADADFDRDLDVDEEDFAVFQAAFTGA